MLDGVCWRIAICSLRHRISLLLWRETILTVADLARVLIIGSRYGLPPVLGTVGGVDPVVDGPSIGSKATSFVMPAARIRPARCLSAAWVPSRFLPL